MFHSESQMHRHREEIQMVKEGKLSPELLRPGARLTRMKGKHCKGEHALRVRQDSDMTVPVQVEGRGKQAQIDIGMQRIIR